VCLPFHRWDLLLFELLVSICCLKLCPKSVMASNPKPQTLKANTTSSTTKHSTNHHQNTQNTASPMQVRFLKSQESTNNQKSISNSHLDPKQQPSLNTITIFLAQKPRITTPLTFQCHKFTLKGSPYGLITIA
jgi:hypothetical protein